MRTNARDLFLSHVKVSCFTKSFADVDAVHSFFIAADIQIMDENEISLRI